MSATPYVSFVTFGRNDSYTPNYTQRVSRSAACLAIQLERAGVDSEIVICDWNSPAGQPLLLDMLELPKAARHVSIRGIVVPPAFHAPYQGSHERGIHNGEAANVGIRRSRGRFVTVKSSDTFLSPATIDTIARQDLDPGDVHRLDRHDVVIEGERLWDLDGEALLDAIERLPSTRQGWIDQPRAWRLRDLHTNACGDFTLMSMAYWHRVRGHPPDPTVLTLDIDSLVLHAAAALGARECRWPDRCRVYKPIHGNLNSIRNSLAWSSWQRPLDRFLSRRMGATVAHRARMMFDYPRRRVRGVPSVLGHSIERNFVQPASGWARGQPFVPQQPENWGLAETRFEERFLCRADFDRA